MHPFPHIYRAGGDCGGLRPAGTDVEAARKLLEQAEHGCLIANSLQGACSLEAQVIVQPAE